jgi:hypothetical protein
VAHFLRPVREATLTLDTDWLSKIPIMPPKPYSRKGWHSRLPHVVTRPRRRSSIGSEGPRVYGVWPAVAAPEGKHAAVVEVTVNMRSMLNTYHSLEETYAVISPPIPFELGWPLQPPSLFSTALQAFLHRRVGQATHMLMNHLDGSSNMRGRSHT